jgi:hypothetical protein
MKRKRRIRSAAGVVIGEGRRATSALCRCCCCCCCSSLSPLCACVAQSLSLLCPHPLLLLFPCFMCFTHAWRMRFFFFCVLRRSFPSPLLLCACVFVCASLLLTWAGKSTKSNRDDEKPAAVVVVCVFSFRRVLPFLNEFFSFCACSLCLSFAHSEFFLHSLTPSLHHIHAVYRPPLLPICVSVLFLLLLVVALVAPPPSLPFFPC